MDPPSPLRRRATVLRAPARLGCTRVSPEAEQEASGGPGVTPTLQRGPAAFLRERCRSPSQSSLKEEEGGRGRDGLGVWD